MTTSSSGARPADTSAYGILFMNAVVIVGALVAGDGLGMLMWPYWMQSMVIGYYSVRRMQKLQTFKTDGLQINGQSVDPTPATQRSTWRFFIVHYGLFHLLYAMFLLGMIVRPAEEPSAWAPFWLAVTFVGFMVSHGQSHREHVESDLRHTRNIGSLMFIPYVRIIPMHLTIIFGAMLGDGIGMLLFGGLKTVADVAMHKIEHRMLQGAG